MKSDTKYNLYAHISDNGDVAEIIMPNELGELTAPAPLGENWFAVCWPVNPHFTGETMIREMIGEAFPTREKISA